MPEEIVKLFPGRAKGGHRDPVHRQAQLGTLVSFKICQTYKACALWSSMGLYWEEWLGFFFLSFFLFSVFLKIFTLFSFLFY